MGKARHCYDNIKPFVLIILSVLCHPDAEGSCSATRIRPYCLQAGLPSRVAATPIVSMPVTHPWGIRLRLLGHMVGVRPPPVFFIVKKIVARLKIGADGELRANDSGVHLRPRRLKVAFLENVPGRLFTMRGFYPYKSRHRIK